MTGEPRRLSLRVQLLDRQVVDPDGALVCKVDDVELAVPDDGTAPRVSALLTGPAALGPRLGGVVGRCVVALHRLLGERHDDDPDRIPVEAVRRIDASVHVRDTRARLGVQRGEDRVRELFVDRLPGAEHESE